MAYQARASGQCRVASHRRVRELMLICISGALLHSGLQHVEGGVVQNGFRSRQLSALKDTSTVVKPDVTCDYTNDTNSGPNPPGPLTLSKDKLSAALQCSGENNKVVPQTVTNVCSVQGDKAEVQGDGAEVKSDGAEGKSDGAEVKSCQDNPKKQVSLTDLLGASGELSWKKTEASASPQSETWLLQLQKEELPLSDKTFFVGCKHAGDTDNPTCKLTVNVHAKPSAVHNNSVTCAYGKASNVEGPLKVTLTEESNSFDLVCGKEGLTNPNSYRTAYCGDAEMHECQRSYKDILPQYEESWWSPPNEELNQAKLTVPATGFPAEDQSFYIGCTLKPAENHEKAFQANSGDPQTSVVNSSDCKVQVTVKAAKYSSASTPVVHIASATSGLAAIAGLLCLVD
ncbi:SAG-related sequence [Besnoitia besnoiti]|uniref:SAG-related sequence n=1 Tax=Besnoitia besnoiti TaxID=94643 RepID=A0A2A9MJM2_BESBE|nr:SAG-related sequence [Besnoitia besnoiti]PFH36166.1 SAG-related sequence [Besnoitia besnoiti]